jgi:hypothetical protein
LSQYVVQIHGNVPADQGIADDRPYLSTRSSTAEAPRLTD